MVDLQSKHRLYSIGYTAIYPRAPTPTMRELYHESGRKIFSSRKDRPVHDCRAEMVKNHTAPEEWDAWLLSHGLRSTYGDCINSHVKPRDIHTPPEKKTPSKLLFQIGGKGSGPADFNYPRGVCATEKGDVVVADSCNHRVQIFSRFGIMKVVFGQRGSGEGEFNEATDVVELADQHIVVADRRNQRIQVFTQQGEYRGQVTTRHQPYSLACDRHNHLAVSTVNRTLEIYTYLQPLASFPVPSNSKKPAGSCPLHIGMTGKGEIIVSDPLDQCVKVFNFNGNLLRQFQPQSHVGGLTCSPGAVFVTAADQILVADTLNHSIHRYSSHGQFQLEVLRATDEAGCVQSLCVGPEGHLIVTQFSVTGEHGVMVFRYRDCACHRGRRPTSKRRTLTALK